MRRAGRVAIASAAVLIVLGIPFTGIKFIPVSASVIPTNLSARQVDDTLTRDFPPNRTNPVEVVVGASARSPQVQALRARLRSLPDVAAVAPAQPAGPSLSLVSVASVAPPISDRTQQLVHRIRALDEPMYVGVSGETAAFVDLEHSLGTHLPAVLAIVVGATLLILFLMTGSVVLPLKAVLMNALGLSAMFGILVWVFQDGHLQSLLGFTSLGAIDATQPVFLFAVGFGLATDYGVFLLSRIKEARDAGAGNTEAVAVGLERTGRIVTAAAALFAVALGAFATSGIVFIKELGLGAALAVLIDASIIRALLVPALMKLLGEWNWWAPRPLRRLHDRIGLSETAGPPAPAPGPPAPAAS
jgi:RND superfamily putative drug exporter